MIIPLLVSKIAFMRRFHAENGMAKLLRLFVVYAYTRIRESLLQTADNVLVEVNGCRMSVMPHDAGISKELIIFRTHEPLNTQIVIQELRKGMICIDVGSNIGYYATLESKMVGSTGKVIAIEPSPKNFAFLKKNLELQDSHNAECYNLAIGNSDGEVRFLLTPKSNHCRVVTEKDIAMLPLENIVTVPIKRLDSFLNEKQVSGVDFIRMDVEGYEKYLFDGMWETIRKYKPMINIEFHKPSFGREGVIEFLQRLRMEGYELKYYVDRLLDMPLLGNDKDIKRINIDKLIEMLKTREERLPPVFHLLLVKNDLQVSLLPLARSVTSPSDSQQTSRYEL